jgi:predicted Zn finger-like uncharacterized protein
VAEDSLEPLITQCPTCRTRFRVTESQLNVAAGRVRCGACLSVFTGLEHLVLAGGPRLKPGESANEALDALLDELGADPEPKSAPTQSPKTQRDTPDSRPQERARASGKVLGATERRPPIARDETAGSVEARATPVDKPEAKQDDAPAPSMDGVAARKARRLKLAAGSTRSQETAVEAASVAPAIAAAEPEPERVPAPLPIDPLTPEDLLTVPRYRRRRWWMPIAVLAAIALLALQVLYLQFDTWAKNPDFRPIYERLCPRLQCQLPVMRSLDEIRSKNLVVRANPDVPGELMVDALIVNQARFAQPFPVIELRFSSMDGRPIAARRFKPEEYLAGELKGATMFAPMTPVHIALAIEDPGTDAVSYYIQFR